MAIPGEGFVDLHHRDFVGMAGHVSYRKIKRLVLRPYQKALLRQGVLCQNAHNEVESEDILMGMEYAGAVGMMVIDELANVNERVSSAVDSLKNKTEELERDGEDLDNCLEAEKDKVWELEEWVIHLELEHHLLRQEMSLAKVAASECVLQMVELMMEVWALWLFQTTLQHGPENPIMVEDNEIVEEMEEEGSNFDGDQVVFPDVGRFSPVLGMLVPIVDEDPQDAAWEVERRDEREELRQCHLMMDDPAWREAMETEQLSCIDLVPGYHAAPAYDVPGHLNLNSD